METNIVERQVMVSPNGHRIPQDYHTHTRASCDTDALMSEMCRSALAHGVREIAFTDHCDNTPGDSCVGFYNPQRYFETLEAARRDFEPQGLTIRAGIEVGEIHRWKERILPVLQAWPYDIVLGSLHWVGDILVFDDSLYRTRPPEDVIPAYFTELEQMVRVGGFDVLAHADVFKRVAYDVYGRFDIREWEDVVRPVWQACIDQGIAVEINASGLRGSVGQTLPSLDALRWYREMGGERLTIGSDGHHPDQVGSGLAAALDLARAAGFQRLCRFEKRQIIHWIEI
jgi:histidinol-phosphatase (PHP family)